ncbi:MAG TPA: hypothetical protein VF984_12150 [Actinomycetota bacterium]
MKLDRVALLLHGEPDVRGVRMLQSVHHALPAYVVEQQRDGWRQLHLCDVGVEIDVGVARSLDDEALKRLRETCRAERRAVKVSDQRPDPI